MPRITPESARDFTNAGESESSDSDDDSIIKPIPIHRRGSATHDSSSGRAMDTISISSSNSSNASQALMSSHAMKMGLYSINLGTKMGQRLHAAHMLFLPLVPVFILMAQNAATYAWFSLQASELTTVQQQVSRAMDLSNLIQKVQEERAAVALNIFLKLDAAEDFDGLKELVTIDLDITKFSLPKTFNATDSALQSIKVWPQIENVDFFETKLKFQIQHSIFRNKIREGDKTIFEVLGWYNQIISFVIDYISVSIHDSDVAGFYRFLIGFKNLLKSVEYSGKSGILGVHYFSNHYVLERHLYLDFITSEKLRNAYLGRTFSFLPTLSSAYRRAVSKLYYEKAQNLVLNSKPYPRAENNSVYAGINYFAQLNAYGAQTTRLVNDLSVDIEEFVAHQVKAFENEQLMPMIIVVVLIAFVPIVVYISLQATSSLIAFSTTYSARVEVYNAEKRQTEKLLTDLLPRPILQQLKRGRIPEPESFESVTIMLADIVGFTTLASESTAHQIVTLLNSLYNLFDNRLDMYDVYKVETVGDAYMVASGVPVRNANHAEEAARLALDLLAKLLSFEVQHKPGYRLKMRMGMHSGPCVAGVVGTKVPKYGIFGESIEITGLMESTGQAMRIQISEPTMELLAVRGGFNFVERAKDGQNTPKQIKNVATFWLIGRSAAGANEDNINNKS